LLTVIVYCAAMADAASTIATQARTASLKDFSARYRMMISLLVVPSRYTNRPLRAQFFLRE
jgi:hypothetical protein